VLPWWTYPAALCFLCGGWWGYLVGYAVRDFIEFGRALGRLLAWRRKYRRNTPWGAYRVLFADIRRAWCTGRWT
jgi:hypothetical protein